MMISPVLFDLEGPLTPEDSAFDLMARTHRGRELFALISRYDDILALRGRSGHEPGETLSLIVPFLFASGIDVEEVASAAEGAILMAGARPVVAELQSKHHPVYMITTAYEPYASVLARRLGFPADNVFSTRIATATELLRELTRKASEALPEIERLFLDVSELAEISDDTVVDYFDTLYAEYWQSPDSTGVRTMGGTRKVEAATGAVERHAASLAHSAYVGDSITDTAVLKAIDGAGGLAISFNGNRHAITPATVAVAGYSLVAITPVLKAWRTGGRDAVGTRLLEGGIEVGSADYVWQPNSNQELLRETILRHERIRSMVREEAGKLG